MGKNQEVSTHGEQPLRQEAAALRTQLEAANNDSDAILKILDGLDPGLEQCLRGRKLADLIRIEPELAFLVHDALGFFAKQEMLGRGTRYTPGRSPLPENLGWYVAAYVETRSPWELEISPLPLELSKFSREFAEQNSRTIQQGHIDTPEKLGAVLNQIAHASEYMRDAHRVDVLQCLIDALPFQVPFNPATQEESSQYLDLCDKLASSCTFIALEKKHSLEDSFRNACSGMEAHPQYLGRLQNIMDRVYDESYWEDEKGRYGQWTAVSYAQEFASKKADEDAQLRQEGELRGLLPGENITVTAVPNDYAKEKFLNKTFASLADLLRLVQEEMNRTGLHGHLTTGVILHEQITALDKARDFQGLKDWPALECYKRLKQEGEWRAVPAAESVEKKSIES